MDNELVKKTLEEQINKLDHRIAELEEEKLRMKQELEEAQVLIKQLLGEQNQMIGLDFSWTGNLGHWYWNVKSNSVIFNPLKVSTLGYTLEEIPERVSFQFFTDKLHPEDYEMTMDAMLRHLHGLSPVYETEYRIRTKEGGYKWYYDRGSITQYSEDGKPLLLAGIVFDITEKKELQLQLEHQNKLLTLQSTTDGLTGLRNHRFLIEGLNERINAYQCTKTPFCIAMFDIDNFKKVNDTKGHLYGDTILSELASIIKNSIRDHDVAGRYGGEEFMVILADSDLEEAYRIAERIRDTIDKHVFSEDGHITISGGVEEIRNGAGASDMIYAADKKLYQAKSQGKNKIIS